MSPAKSRHRAGPRRTNREIQRLRAAVIMRKGMVIRRYEAGESIAALALAYDVSGKWLRAQFDTWNIPVPRQHRSGSAAPALVVFPAPPPGGQGGSPATN